jgi:acetyl esterase/lipase
LGNPQIERLVLWPEGLPEPAPANLAPQYRERAAPGASPDRELTGVVDPFLDIHRPERPNGAAIILVPGGGYRHMAIDKEGYDLARWFAARGVTAAVLAYRLPTEGWAHGGDTPLADAQRAVRLLRSRAVQLGISATHVAAMGFSAGGHLVANLGTQFGCAAYAPNSPIDQLSARPDLVAPIYPAISLDRLSQGFPPGETIFGKGPAADILPHIPSQHVPIDPPPFFLLHAEDDPLVDPSHSLDMRAALLAKGGQVETHIFAQGGHGFGLRKAIGLPLENWPNLFLNFARALGWTV